jgi:hypothetical protein
MGGVAVPVGGGVAEPVGGGMDCAEAAAAVERRTAANARTGSVRFIGMLLGEAIFLRSMRRRKFRNGFGITAVR